MPSGRGKSSDFETAFIFLTFESPDQQVKAF
jgi:hypothetical protein